MSNLVINNVVYASVPEIDVPKQGGGTAKFYETSSANVSASDVLTGKTAFGASGSVSGSMPNNGSTGGTISTKAGSVTIPAGYTTGGTVSLGGVSDCVPSSILSGKTILGIQGSLVLPNISQDATSHILNIS